MGCFDFLLISAYLMFLPRAIWPCFTHLIPYNLYIPSSKSFIGFRVFFCKSVSNFSPGIQFITILNFIGDIFLNGVSFVTEFYTSYYVDTGLIVVEISIVNCSFKFFTCFSVLISLLNYSGMVSYCTVRNTLLFVLDFH